MSEYEAPEYELYSYEDLANALAEIRRQHAAGEPLVWTGPDRLHHSVSATTPGPSWYFSDEGAEYEAERGRDFWDRYTQVAFSLGFHQGAVREEEHTKFWQRMSKLDSERYETWLHEAMSYKEALDKFAADGFGNYVKAILRLKKKVK